MASNRHTRGPYSGSRGSYLAKHQAFGGGKPVDICSLEKYDLTPVNCDAWVRKPEPQRQVANRSSSVPARSTRNAVAPAVAAATQASLPPHKRGLMNRASPSVTVVARVPTTNLRGQESGTLASARTTFKNYLLPLTAPLLSSPALPSSLPPSRPLSLPTLPPPPLPDPPQSQTAIAVSDEVASREGEANSLDAGTFVTAPADAVAPLPTSSGLQDERPRSELKGSLPAGDSVAAVAVQDVPPRMVTDVGSSVVLDPLEMLAEAPGRRFGRELGALEPLQTGITAFAPSPSNTKTAAWDGASTLTSERAVSQSTPVSMEQPSVISVDPMSPLMSHIKEARAGMERHRQAIAERRAQLDRVRSVVKDIRSGLKSGETQAGGGGIVAGSATPSLAGVRTTLFGSLDLLQQRIQFTPQEDRTSPAPHIQPTPHPKTGCFKTVALSSINMPAAATSPLSLEAHDDQGAAIAAEWQNHPSPRSGRSPSGPDRLPLNDLLEAMSAAVSHVKSTSPYALGGNPSRGAQKTPLRSSTPSRKAPADSPTSARGRHAYMTPGIAVHAVGRTLSPRSGTKKSVADTTHGIIEDLDFLVSALRRKSMR